MKWRIIFGYPTYSVTDAGQVLSFWKDGGCKLKNSLNSSGYHKVGLYNDLGRKWFLVHRLVMVAFCGPSELDVNHINGVRSDNRLENLEYVTAKENTRHSIEVLGNSMAGVRHSNCKLTQQQIDDIRIERAAGETQISIAKRYNIAQNTVSQICNRKRHK